MSEVRSSLCRYMPEWMAEKGAALLAALPEPAAHWAQDTAAALAIEPGPPGRDAWRDEIVRRFGDGRRSKERDAIVGALRGAVLLVAIQQLPAPVLMAADSGPPDIRSTKELDLPAVKRSRILGLLEPCLTGYDDQAEALVRSLT